MKPLLFILAFFLFGPAHAQVWFGSKGLIDSVYWPARTGDALRADRTMTNEQKVSLKKELSNHLRKAIDSLENNDLYYRNFYNSVWGVSAVDRALQDMKELKKWLDGKPYNQAHTFLYTPSPIQLDTGLFNRPVYELAALSKDKDNDGLQTASLVVTDPLRSWMIREMRRTQPSARPSMTDYLRGWRQLEKAYRQTNEYLKTVSVLTSKNTNCGDTVVQEIEAFLAGRNNWRTNAITGLVRDSFYLKWLWFTSGVLQMNPLPATEDEDLYPAGEANSFLPDSVRNLLYGNNTVNYQKFIMTSRVVNTVLVSDEKIKSKKKKSVIYYDASHRYHSWPPALPKYISDKDNILVLVNNVPQGTDLVLDEKSAKLDDRSNAAIQADVIFSQVGDLVKIATPALAGIDLINTRFNSLSNHPSFVNIPAPHKATMPEADVSIQSERGFFQKEIQKTYSTLSSDESVEVTVVEIRSQKVLLTKDIDTDKVRILRAWQEPQYKKGCDSCALIPSGLLEGFLLQDRCFLLDYTNNQTIVRSIEAMERRFICYWDAVKRCTERLKELNDQLLAERTFLLPYIKIVNRSRPPEEIEELRSGEPPLYATKYLETNIPDAPTTYSYSVTSTVKTADGKGESKVVITQTIKVGKTYYIDAGAGIAINTRNYTVNRKGDNGLPQADPGNQVQVIAGLHIYPFGLVKQDNRFCRDLKKRSSLFLGLAIPKALDHFYVGYSYDPVPGFRLIAGYHFYRNTRFTLLNNRIVDEAKGIRTAGPFFAFNIEPKTLFSVLGLIK